MHKKLFSDPEYKRKNKEMLQERFKDEEFLVGFRLAIQKRTADPEWKRKNYEKNMRVIQDPEWKRNHTKLLESRKDHPTWNLNHHESMTGGFWYGAVTYGEPRKYCELWCKDLWDRIDAAQNYQSILSGKTKEDNICGGKPCALSRHHVYWQPKACCEWDEDVKGYYAMINIGTKKKPDWYKHYIKGDPNKFVLLTAQEHGMIKKDKLKWIKIFEDLIESELGGVCYLPKKKENS